MDTLLSTFTPPFLPCKPTSIHSSLLPSKPFKLLRSSPHLSTAVAAAATPSSAIADDLEPLGIENLRRFFDINVGKWSGTFFQYDGSGNLLHRLKTKLSASTYGEDELMSLIQTLYVRQPPSSTSIAEQDEEPEWFEYKIKETNMFTVDKYQQIGFFPKEKAFSLRYQTAGMLEAVLRAGVLGEDDTGEESPRNLKIPSRFPSVVCENCLYSLDKDMRVRVFHIMDPKGILEMIILFLENRGDEVLNSFPTDSLLDKSDRLSPLLGRWEGRSITRRSGVYGATVTEADTVALLEVDDKGQLIQDISSTVVGSSNTTNVHWTGTVNNNLVVFDRGFQMTLLPGGMYMGCPCDIGKCVADSTSFHLEFCWTESQDKRQRLVRTYDVEGQAVSSTYFYETKV